MPTTKRWFLSFFSTLLILIAVGFGLFWNAGAADLFPPSRRPIDDRQLDVPLWERSSSSPWGGSRIGGYDAMARDFTLDGRKLVGMDSGTWQFEIFDAETGASEGKFGRVNDFRFMAVSPAAGWSVLLHGQGQVDLWDLTHRRFARSLDEGVSLDHFQFATFLDERRCVLATGRTLCIWDVETGDELDRWTPVSFGDRGYQAIRGLAASPGGAALAVVENNRLYVIETTTRDVRVQLARLSSDARSPHALAELDAMKFSADGRLLAVASAGAIRLFDVVAGIELPPLVGHQDAIRALYFAPNGSSLKSFDKENRLLTWNLEDVRRPWDYTGPPPTREGIIHAIETMESGDAWQAYAAERVLKSAPDQSLSVLEEDLKPVPVLDKAVLSTLIAQISSEDFNTRKAGMRAMGDAGEQVLAAMNEMERNRFTRDAPRLSRTGDEMRRVLAERFPTLEQRRRVQRVSLLAGLRTLAAKEHMTRLAAGAEGALLTKAAQTALADWLESVASATSSLHTWESERAKLQEADAKQAYRVMQRLVAAWNEYGGHVRTELLSLDAEPGLDAPMTDAERWIEQLNDQGFEEREEASRRLAQMGTSIAPRLRKALEASPPPETRQRIQNLLLELKSPRPSQQQLLAVRLIETAVLASSTESRQMLRDIAEKATSSWLRAQIKLLSSSSPAIE